MHRKVPEHERRCVQNNQLPTKSHVDGLDDNSLMYVLPYAKILLLTNILQSGTLARLESSRCTTNRDPPAATK